VYRAGVLTPGGDLWYLREGCPCSSLRLILSVDRIRKIKYRADKRRQRRLDGGLPILLFYYSLFTKATGQFGGSNK